MEQTGWKFPALLSGKSLSNFPTPVHWHVPRWFPDVPCLRTIPAPARTNLPAPPVRKQMPLLWNLLPAEWYAGTFSASILPYLRPSRSVSIPESFQALRLSAPVCHLLSPMPLLLSTLESENAVPRSLPFLCALQNRFFSAPDEYHIHWSHC